MDSLRIVSFFNGFYRPVQSPCFPESGMKSRDIGMIDPGWRGDLVFWSEMQTLERACCKLPEFIRISDMRLLFSCPSCLQTIRTTAELPEKLTCPSCSWSKELGVEERRQDPPGECLICGCRDLWRQKDFPQRLGVAMVGMGALLSTIAWAYYLPLWSIGILLFFAFIDLMLYLFMPDVLVCYRCGARYGGSARMEKVEFYNLETAERYRQEKIRLEQGKSS